MKNMLTKSGVPTTVYKKVTRVNRKLYHLHSLHITKHVVQVLYNTSFQVPREHFQSKFFDRIHRTDMFGHKSCYFRQYLEDDHIICNLRGCVHIGQDSKTQEHLGKGCMYTNWNCVDISIAIPDYRRSSSHLSFQSTLISSLAVA